MAFFFKKIHFQQVKNYEGSSYLEVDVFGCKSFFVLQGCGPKSHNSRVLKKVFILDESNHDEGSSRLEDGGNRTPQFSGIKVFFLYEEGRFGLAYEAFTFGTGPECKVSQHWFSSIRYELGQSVVRA